MIAAGGVSGLMVTYALTLIGATKSGPLRSAHLDQVRARLDLDFPPDWLAEDEACDLIFPSDLSAAEITAEALSALQGTKIDAVCTPAKGRRKQMLISDMDSTIIDQECIVEMGDVIGVGPQISRITQAAIDGKVGFAEALRRRVALMKGMEYSLLERVCDQRITLTPGARTLVRTMRRHGAYCILVSGGFDYFASRIAEKIGFHDYQANELICEAGKLTGKVLEPILGRTAKLDTLRSLCAAKGLSGADVLAAGDGANDMKMIEAAGLGVAFHGSCALQDHANACINHSDLTSLLYIQGYRKSEFDLS